MSRFVPGLAFVAGVFLSSGGPILARGPLFVTAHAVVVGQDGPIRNLPATDFTVFVDGTPIPISHVSAGDEPLSVVALLDISASNGLSKTRDLAAKRQVRTLMAGLSPRDRMKLGGFAAAISLSPTFLASAGDLEAQAESLFAHSGEQRYGPSRLWDGLDQSVQALEQETGRRVIVVFTDGGASGNTVGRAEVLARAVSADVSISVVITSRVFVATPRLLTIDAEATGGILVEALGDPKWDEIAIHRVTDVLEAGYRLEFAVPEADDQAHDLRIQVRTPNTHVLCRTSFRAVQRRPKM